MAAHARAERALPSSIRWTFIESGHSEDEWDEIGNDLPPLHPGGERSGRRGTLDKPGQRLRHDARDDEAEPSERWQAAERERKREDFIPVQCRTCGITQSGTRTAARNRATLTSYSSTSGASNSRR